MSEEEFGPEHLEDLFSWASSVGHDVDDIDSQVVLVSFFVGPHDWQIHQITGIDIAEVERVGMALREGGAWARDKINASADPDDFAMESMLHVLVAKGWLTLEVPPED